MKENSKNKERNNSNEISMNYLSDISQLENENRILKNTVAQLNEELSRFQRNPLMVAEVKEIFKENALIRLNNGNEFFVDISPGCEKLKSGDLVLVEQRNLTIIRKIETSRFFNVERFIILEKPKVSWDQIGGLSSQIEEIKEVIELPLLKPHLFEKVGITPPKGILLYGPPGTGKTLLAKAVASSTNSTFIEVVASELVQKFIGEGAKLISDIFELAKQKAPSIIFIDELDALAAKRIDLGTSGEREVQRTFMQLLAELDGFEPLSNVKVIGCTNRKDILDPAILRPGRLDRLIEIPLPDENGIREIFNIHTRKMSFEKNFDKEKIIKELNGFSGAEIMAVVTEAGYFAIRENRTKLKEEDFFKAIKKVKKKEENKEYLQMFG